MKTIKGFLIAPLLLITAVSHAADEDYVPAVPLEVPAKYVKVSNDGTGVVSGFKCSKCIKKVLKITKNTTAYVNNKETDILRVKENRDRLVLVNFTRDKGEVLDIRWFE